MELNYLLCSMLFIILKFEFRPHNFHIEGFSRLFWACSDYDDDYVCLGLISSAGVKNLSEGYYLSAFLIPL